VIRDQDVHPATTDRRSDCGVLGGTSCHCYSTRNAAHRIDADTDDSVIEGGDVIASRIEESQADVTNSTFLAKYLRVLGGDCIATLTQEEGRLKASYPDQQEAQLLPRILDRGYGRVGHQRLACSRGAHQAGRRDIHRPGSGELRQASGQSRGSRLSTDSAQTTQDLHDFVRDLSCPGLELQDEIPIRSPPVSVSSK
jgi:hypothetical protein